MNGNEGQIPQSFAELSPAQRWKITRHPGPYMLSMGWGAFCGILFGWFFYGFIVITVWSTSLSSSPLGVALAVLLLVGHVGVCIGSPFIAHRFYRSAEARLVAEFLAAEAELPSNR